MLCCVLLYYDVVLKPEHKATKPKTLTPNVEKPNKSRVSTYTTLNPKLNLKPETKPYQIGHIFDLATRVPLGWGGVGWGGVGWERRWEGVDLDIGEKEKERETKQERESERERERERARKRTREKDKNTSGGRDARGL